VHKILIVEDEQKLRKIMREQLAEGDFEIIEAEDADEAIKIIQEQSKQIDLIILDLLLKEISGAYIFDYLKKNHPTIKVIISSIFDKSEQQFFVDRADDYYCKMDDFAELKYKVKSLLLETDNLSVR